MLIIAKPGFRQRVARRGYSMFSLAKEAGLAKESVTPACAWETCKGGDSEETVPGVEGGI